MKSLPVHPKNSFLPSRTHGSMYLESTSRQRPDPSNRRKVIGVPVNLYVNVTPSSAPDINVPPKYRAPATDDHPDDH